MGGEWPPARGFRAVSGAAKRDSPTAKRLNRSGAVAKYSNPKRREVGWTKADLAIARQHLSPALLELFSYPIPNVTLRTLVKQPTSQRGWLVAPPDGGVRHWPFLGVPLVVCVLVGLVALMTSVLWLSCKPCKDDDSEPVDN
mmetsp:Transcript_16998/g.34383  ORF Transcript_16998/g.34383 Transcript_16998/m.34383 type:complete len:142 (-) Transcript_16998:193-618(-)|eukprot:CAMPEP_0174727358 /NCGR_PEP_ID=MMETSP1094-20130205/49614_1 /TAXON_ID=156173 /ORGANISM="Chrysochromulina brevifilum, Strain UTEX LB 985" /LENGTH=141 /DNA_ID=CAMNT_0015929079 /DNA_START=176 /DNA_END=601 /DNA_ORIENTATION=+